MSSAKVRYSWIGWRSWLALLLFFAVSGVGATALNSSDLHFGPHWRYLVLMLFVGVCMATERGRLRIWVRLPLIFAAPLFEILLEAPIFMTIGKRLYLAGMRELLDPTITFWATLPIVVLAMRQSKLFVKSDFVRVPDRKTHSFVSWGSKRSRVFLAIVVVYAAAKIPSVLHGGVDETVVTETLPDGSWTTYSVQQELLEGPATVWNPAGAKIAHGSYINDGQDGRWTYWHDNGQLAQRVNYSVGKRNGLTEAWYENGNRKLTTTYVDGVAHGWVTTWHENGIMRSRGIMSNGLQEGEWTQWYPNGQMKEQGMWKHALAVGTWKFWHPNGAMMAHGEFVDGVPSGDWEYWTDDGRPSRAVDTTLSMGI